MNAAEIEAVIPHRPPFRFVDEIVELEPGVRAVGRLAITGEEWYLPGHFPGNPIVPGVIMVEACAQVAAVCALTHPDHQGKFGVFAAIDETRFTRIVRPGDVLDIDDRDGAAADAARPLQRRRSRCGGEPAVRGDAHVRPARGAAGVIGALRSTRRHRLDRRGGARAGRHERRDRGAHRHQRRVDPRAHRHRRAAHRRARRVRHDLGIAAAQQALDRSGMAPAEIDFVVCATCSPDSYFPSVAATIADGVGAHARGAPYDVSAACTGWVYALTHAVTQIQAGLAEHVLVVGAETLSKVLDWDDRATCILFGDGAGACVLSADACRETVFGDRARRRRRARQRPDRRRPRAARNVIEMDGGAVFRFATTVMVDSTRRSSTRAGSTSTDVDWIVPHQANSPDHRQCREAPRRRPGRACS